MKLLILCSALGGCAVDGDDHQIAIEPNAMGITSLRSVHAQQDGNDVFSLHGYTAAGEELASVRLTVGTIADLPTIAPGDAQGSEILLAADGTNLRIVSHEKQLFELQPPTEQPAIAHFLALPAVATILRVEAHVLVPWARPDGELAYDLGPPSGAVCPTLFLNTSPIANQCCWTNPYPGGGQITLFVRPSDHMVVSRKINPLNMACKASDGSSACSGNACYYGPNKFARATFSTNGTNPIIRNHHDADGVTRCTSYTTGAVQYSNITGSFATGQGCPGGAGGMSTDWDY